MELRGLSAHDFGSPHGEGRDLGPEPGWAFLYAMKISFMNLIAVELGFAFMGSSN